jgi:sugar lactone lactonase YvrE
MATMTTTTTPELVLDTHSQVGEGPVWIAERGILAWVDILGNLVHLFDPRTGDDRTIDVGQAVGAVLPRTNGGWVVAIRDGVAFLDEASGSLTMLVEIEADNPANRMNDAKCDSRGRLWAGTVAFDFSRGVGSLYRIDPGGVATRVLRDLNFSNGLDWTADDSRMYYIDSFSDGIAVFDFDSDAGTIANRRTVVTVLNDESTPCGFTVADGMTLDAEGHLWVAMCGLGEVRRYSAEGELEHTIELPVLGVTSVAFGGDDLGDLYITTAANWPADHPRTVPEQGGLFRCRPGVAGRLPHAFAG